MKFIAAIGLGLYLLYGFAFYAEGYKGQGGPALKTLGTTAELFVVAALIWELAA